MRVLFSSFLSYIGRIADKSDMSRDHFSRDFKVRRDSARLRGPVSRARARFAGHSRFATTLATTRDSARLYTEHYVFNAHSLESRRVPYCAASIAKGVTRSSRASHAQMGGKRETEIAAGGPAEREVGLAVEGRFAVIPPCNICNARRVRRSYVHSFTYVAAGFLCTHTYMSIREYIKIHME